MRVWRSMPPNGAAWRKHDWGDVAVIGDQVTLRVVFFPPEELLEVPQVSLSSGA